MKFFNLFLLLGVFIFSSCFLLPGSARKRYSLNSAGSKVCQDGYQSSSDGCVPEDICSSFLGEGESCTYPSCCNDNLDCVNSVCKAPESCGLSLSVMSVDVVSGEEIPVLINAAGGSGVPEVELKRYLFKLSSSVDTGVVCYSTGTPSCSNSGYCSNGTELRVTGNKTAYIDESVSGLLTINAIACYNHNAIECKTNIGSYTLDFGTNTAGCNSNIDCTAPTAQWCNSGTCENVGIPVLTGNCNPVITTTYTNHCKYTINNGSEQNCPSEGGIILSTTGQVVRAWNFDDRGEKTSVLSKTCSIDPCPDNTLNYGEIFETGDCTVDTCKTEVEQLIDSGNGKCGCTTSTKNVDCGIETTKSCSVTTNVCCNKVGLYDSLIPSECSASLSCKSGEARQYYTNKCNCTDKDHCPSGYYCTSSKQCALECSYESASLDPGIAFSSPCTVSVCKSGVSQTVNAAVCGCAMSGLGSCPSGETCTTEKICTGCPAESKDYGFHYGNAGCTVSVCKSGEENQNSPYTCGCKSNTDCPTSNTCITDEHKCIYQYPPAGTPSFVDLNQVSLISGHEFDLGDRIYVKQTNPSTKVCFRITVDGSTPGNPICTMSDSDSFCLGDDDTYSNGIWLYGRDGLTNGSTIKVKAVACNYNGTPSSIIIGDYKIRDADLINKFAGEPCTGNISCTMGLCASANCVCENAICKVKQGETCYTSFSGLLFQNDKCVSAAPFCADHQYTPYKVCQTTNPNTSN